MSTIQDQMATYSKVLHEYKPAQDKPVTEIAIFKLRQPQSPATLEHFEAKIIANTTPGKGIKRQAWGFSENDPFTLVWMLDWEKIQLHWDFWQTPAFGPVIEAINTLFVEGRPLVRHYDFQPTGMLQQRVQRVFVWNNEKREDPRASVQGQSKAQDQKVAYAVDMDETSWLCTVFGYESEEDAYKDVVIQHEGQEAHLVKMTFSEQPNK